MHSDLALEVWLRAWIMSMSHILDPSCCDFFSWVVAEARSSRWCLSLLRSFNSCKAYRWSPDLAFCNRMTARPVPPYKTPSPRLSPSNNYKSFPERVRICEASKLSRKPPQRVLYLVLRWCRFLPRQTVPTYLQSLSCQFMENKMLVPCQLLSARTSSREAECLGSLGYLLASTRDG